jgi:hypothetical protein
MYIGGMARRSTGARFNLGEPWDGNLADFCAAHYDASATSVVKQALDQFFAARLAAEPEVAKRVEDARRKRIGLVEGGNVTALPKAKTPK